MSKLEQCECWAETIPSLYGHGLTCQEALLLAFGEVKDVSLRKALAGMIIQRGCEHFEESVKKDGRLTSLMDVIIFG